MTRVKHYKPRDPTQLAEPFSLDETILYRVVSCNFVAGLLMNKDNWLITAAAPIMKWTIGKHYTIVRRYCIKHNMKIERVDG